MLVCIGTQRLHTKFRGHPLGGRACARPQTCHVKAEWNNFSKVKSPLVRTLQSKETVTDLKNLATLATLVAVNTKCHFLTYCRYFTFEKNVTYFFFIYLYCSNL